MRFSNVETQAVHAGRAIDAATSAVATPIHLSTTFERSREGDYPNGFAYSTFNNPNRAWLEGAAAQLEGGRAAIATASGMGAIACVFASLRPGDRVLVSHDLFQGTARLINDQVRRWGVVADLADTCRPDAVAAALRPETRMIWIDTPSNPLMRVTDIAAVAEIAKTGSARVVVDSTFATIALQRPLDLGADVSVYAGTKYIGGHSDVVNGLAVFRQLDSLYEEARSFQINAGVTPSPFDCWLVHRGLRTLPLRMRKHSDNAQLVATFLEGHSKVARVHYPGLASSEWHDVAERQMPQGCGGMLSFSVKGGREAAISAVARTCLFTRAASLGGVESLIEHRASSPTQVLGRGTGFKMPQDLIRLSVGIEHPDDLIEDLDQALRSRRNT